MITLIAAEFSDTLEAHDLRYLGVGVHIVEIVHPLRHRREQPAVRETLGHIEVLLFLGDGIGIGQHFVHATVLVTQHLFHLGIRETCREVDGPVAEAEEQGLRLFIATIQPRIAQARVHLMKIIERRP